MLISRLLLLSVVAILAGCSYPMDYQTRATPTFPTGRAKEKVVVVGVDRRDYLLKKEIKPQYVGLFRDLMAAIPYKWVTKSKNPVSDDLAINTAKGLQKAGYMAVAVLMGQNVAGLKEQGGDFPCIALAALAHKVFGPAAAAPARPPPCP